MKNGKLKAGTIAAYLFLIIYSVVSISPLVIVLSSSFRKPENMTSPLKLFIEFSPESYRTAFTKMGFMTEFANSVWSNPYAVRSCIYFLSGCGTRVASLQAILLT